MTQSITEVFGEFRTGKVRNMNPLGALLLISRRRLSSVTLSALLLSSQRIKEAQVAK
jgi:hypothetical protein